MLDAEGNTQFLRCNHLSTTPLKKPRILGRSINVVVFLFDNYLFGYFAFIMYLLFIDSRLKNLGCSYRPIIKWAFHMTTQSLPHKFSIGQQLHLQIPPSNLLTRFEGLSAARKKRKHDLQY